MAIKTTARHKGSTSGMSGTSKMEREGSRGGSVGGSLLSGRFVKDRTLTCYCPKLVHVMCHHCADRRGLSVAARKDEFSVRYEPR